MNSQGWAPVGVVAGVVALVVYLLFPSRKAIWKIVKARLRGERVHTLIRGEDGSIKGACPKCGGSVDYSEVNAGRRAFSCPHCGETGDWIEDS
jgi:endogenous inhibitor of DNA gyrase (YacG/DUF329 family)